MHKSNNHGSLAHSRGDTLHTLSPDIADRKDSGEARFEQIKEHDEEASRLEPWRRS
jgi:hypothetical protein